MAVVCDEAMLFEVSEAKEACISLGWPLNKLKAKYEEGVGFLVFFWGQKFLSQ
jgi:hypothetical protein